MRARRAYARWLSIVVLATLVLAPSRSWAWKPFTHVYLAQQAWQDAVDDGNITIYWVDKRTAQLVRDGSGQPQVMGTYPVHPRILRALRNSPAKFFAGVLGPDAYPDILTGQMRIHPPGPDDEHAPDADVGGPGTDAWLQQLWVRAWELGSDDAIAFATGFLAHAAGDIYAHTFMNTFAGGIFDLKDRSTFNWFKHVTVEGYVAQRTPELALIARNRGAIRLPPASIYDIVRDDGITGLEGFIADNTWDVRDAGGHSMFPTEQNKDTSVPYHLGTFLDTVTRVNAQVSAYDTGLQSDLSHAWYNASPLAAARELLWACDSGSCPDPTYDDASCPGEYPRGDAWCLAMLAGGIGVWSSGWFSLAGALAPVYHAEHPLAVALERWTDNAITTTPIAMRDWVSASHNAAIHLFFTSDHLVHTDGAEFPDGASLSDGYALFKIDLESILTGIDRGTVSFINDLVDLITSPVDALEAAVGDAERWLVDRVFQATFHMTPDQAKQCFVKPHMWLNPLLRNNPSGTKATLQSLNKIMRLPDIAPLACPGSTARCTIAPSLVGADVTGACDIMAGPTVATFSVRPGDPQGVFPAAFNAVTMIKLSLVDPDALRTLATYLAHGRTLALDALPAGGGVAPPNAMLGFAATIDGSHEWLARRNGNGWGTYPMILARDCDAYWSVFVDQRPDFDTSSNDALTGRTLAPVMPNLLPDIDRAWEPAPMSNCPGYLKWNIPPSLLTKLNNTIGTTGYAQLTVNEPATFRLAGAGKNASASTQAQGSIIPAPDGLSARYVPPKWNLTGHDQIIVTSKDGARRTIIPVNFAGPALVALRREPARAPQLDKALDPIGLRSGETAQLVRGSKSPMAWSVLNGPGSVGDPKLESTHAATLARYTNELTASEQRIRVQARKVNDQNCRGACRAQALAVLRKVARARTTAALGAALAKRQLDIAHTTYHAPKLVDKDSTVTLRGADSDGSTATVKLLLLARPPALQPKLAATSVQSGKQLELGVEAGLPSGKYPAPPLPMKWKITSGPGTVGDPASKERASYAAQTQTFLAGLQPLSKQLAEARPFEAAAARKRWLDYMQANVQKFGPAFARLDVLDRTYQAPAHVATKQRVTVRGTAQDGSGRTIDVSFDVEP